MIRKASINYNAEKYWLYSFQEIVLSGWQLIRKAGALETNFKFHRSAKIDAGATVTVWSADIGASHEPPTNLVMKGQKWFVADNMSTTLLNSDGEASCTILIIENYSLMC